MAKWPTDKELEEIYRKGSESTISNMTQVLGMR
ncbi:MAG: hypothetical protein ACJA01_003596 [Saprospiraceae bacterium]|jgi:hypothetical protein